MREATQIPYQKTCKVTRRAVRDFVSGDVVEDLKICKGTSRKPKHRQLKDPMDIVIEIDACEEEEKEDE